MLAWNFANKEKCNEIIELKDKNSKCNSAQSKLTDCINSDQLAMEIGENLGEVESAGAKWK